MKYCPECGTKLFSEYHYDGIKSELHLQKRCCGCDRIFCKEVITKYYHPDFEYINRTLEYADKM